MQLIDTHAHICFDSYDEDREEIMARAYEAGVYKLVHPCCRVPEIPQLIELAKIYDGNDKVNLFMALGIHPTEVDGWNDDTSKLIIEHLEANTSNPNSKIKAIGETGLDYYHAPEAAQQDRQKQVFNEQISIAKQYQLPLILHVRDAWQDALDILKSHFPQDRDGNHGVMHCYTGDADFAKQAIEYGFYISWSGIVTFKKNDHYREIAKEIDLDRVLIETDCPFLAPQVKRGKRNEPSFVTYVADTLAECYDISKEELAKVSTDNAERLFKI